MHFHALHSKYLIFNFFTINIINLNTILQTLAILNFEKEIDKKRLNSIEVFSKNVNSLWVQWKIKIGFVENFYSIIFVFVSLFLSTVKKNKDNFGKRAFKFTKYITFSKLFMICIIWFKQLFYFKFNPQTQ